MEWAHEANVPIIITGEGRIPEGMSVEESLKILKNRYEELLKVAEKNKVYFAIEDHGSISLNTDGLPKLLKLVQSDWIGVNFDTANIHRGDYVGTNKEGYEWKLEDGEFGGYSEVELLKKIASRVKHVHIKDVIGRDAVTLGEGEIDIVGCLRVLKNVDFDGVLSYETEGMEGTKKSIEMITKSRQFLINAIKNI